MERQFFNSSQPQTMQGAVFLLYANVIVALIWRTGGEGLFALTVNALSGGNLGRGATLIGNLTAVFVVAGSAYSGYLIANEKKVGWRLGIVVATLPVVALLVLVALGDVSVIDAISVRLLFDVALIALLLHNQTRAYEKIWFK